MISHSSLREMTGMVASRETWNQEIALNMTAWSGIPKIQILWRQMKMVIPSMTVSSRKSTYKNMSANSPSLTTSVTNTVAMSM